MSTPLSLPSLVRLSPASDVVEERDLLERIAARLRAGDVAWSERVLRELVPDVRRWMLRLLGPRHVELDDAIQDALTELASALHRFEGRASLSTLAHRITVRTAYRYYGRRARSTAPLEELCDRRLDPEHQASARESIERLLTCLDRLPASRRTAFVLCAVEGLKPADAAEIMGTTSSAVRSLLCRAREQIAAAMHEEVAR